LKIRISKLNHLKLPTPETETGWVHSVVHHQEEEWQQQLVVVEVVVLAVSKDHRQPVHKTLDSEKFRKNLRMKEKRKEEWLIRLNQ
jgi:hypothetical protein